MPDKKQPRQRGHLRPKNTEKDSYNYWLPHDVAFKIDALAAVEGEELRLDDLTPAGYLTRLIRTLAAEKLSPEKLEEAQQWAETKEQERIQRAEQRGQDTEPEAAVS